MHRQSSSTSSTEGRNIDLPWRLKAKADRRKEFTADYPELLKKVNYNERALMIPIFLYGITRKGQEFHSLIWDATYIGKVHTFLEDYRMYNLIRTFKGGKVCEFPGIAKYKNTYGSFLNGFIVGELYLSSLKTLEVLDVVHMQDGLFFRDKVSVSTFAIPSTQREKLPHNLRASTAMSAFTYMFNIDQLRNGDKIISQTDEKLRYIDWEHTDAGSMVRIPKN